MQNKGLTLRLAHPHESFHIIEDEVKTEEECKHVCRCDASLCTMKCPPPLGAAGCEPGELYTRYRWVDKVEGMTMVKGANGEYMKECMCSIEVLEKSGNLVLAKNWGMMSKKKFEEKCQECKVCGNCSPTCRQKVSGFKCI